MNPLNLKKLILTGLAGNFALRLASIALIMTSGILLARTLGAGAYGDYIFILSIITILGIPIQSGLHTLIVRETAYYKTTGQWSLLRGLFSFFTNWVALCCTLTVAISLALIASELIESRFQHLTLALALALLPLTQINLLRSAMLRGLAKVSLSEIPEQIVKPAISVFILSLTLYFNIDLSLENTLSITLLGAAAAFAVSYHLIASNKPKKLNNAVVQRDIQRWKRSWLPLAMFSWVHIANSQINVLLLGSLSDNISVGIFQVGFQGAAVVAIALTVINSVTAPHIVTLHTEARHSALQTLLTRSAQLATLCAAFMLGIYWFWGESIIILIFGEEFKESWKCMIILSIGHFVSACAGSVGITLQMMGHDKSTTQLMGAGFLINLVLSFALIPIYGAEGSAIAYTSSVILWNSLLVFKLKSATTLNSTIFRASR